MESVIAALQRAIDAASSLAAELQTQPSQHEIDDFFSLCQRFIDLRTKCILAKRIEDNDFPPDFSSDHLASAHARYEELKEEARAVEQSLQSIEPERLQRLIAEAKRLLADVTERLGRSQGADVDELIRLADEELAQLETVATTHGWYESAYRRLSEFSGIRIDEDGTIRLLETHKISFAQSSVSIDPPSVFVGDLDPSESSNAVCISEVIERIAAFNNLTGVARQIGWEVEVGRDAPIVMLFPSASAVPAMFALIGYQEHPLVEWGSVDPEEFNVLEQPLAGNLKRCAPRVRAI
jgi:hypothetical protein